MIPPTPFWLVWNPQSPRAPRVRHDDERDAIAEAERLARAHPSQVFIVMASVAGFVKDDIRRIDIQATPNRWPDDEEAF